MFRHVYLAQAETGNALCNGEADAIIGALRVANADHKDVLGALSGHRGRDPASESASHRRCTGRDCGSPAHSAR